MFGVPSPDGKYLAVLALSKDLTNEVEVWSLETGKRLSSFAADSPKTPAEWRVFKLCAPTKGRSVAAK